MLYLISLGLWDEKDMSLRALEAGRKCKKLYLELYTSPWFGSRKELERLFGKPIELVGRQKLEEGISGLIEEARKTDVGILVPGDALSATTHLSILAEAKRQKVKARVIHGSSILTAIAESGLSLYRFGQTVTLPKDGPKKSFWDAVRKNLRAGLHTLVLLEPGLGLERALKLLKLKRPLVAGCRFGGETLIRYGRPSKLKELGDCQPAVLVIPAKLSFYEEEFLSILAKE